MGSAERQCCRSSVDNELASPRNTLRARIREQNDWRPEYAKREIDSRKGRRGLIHDGIVSHGEFYGAGQSSVTPDAVNEVEISHCRTRSDQAESCSRNRQICKASKC